MIFFSHLMMSRMLLSSSCVLVFLLCLSHECNGRHLSNIDDDHAKADNPKLLNHSTIKGFENDPLAVHTDLNLKTYKKGKGQPITVHDDHHNKQTDCKSQKKKDMLKDLKVKKVKEELFHHHHHHNHRHQLQNPESLATVTFHVPPKNKRVHQQPGFNLDYSPPKTHPPSHN